MFKNAEVALIGYASGIAAGDPGCGDGPIVLDNDVWVSGLNQSSSQANFSWQSMLQPKKLPVLTAVADMCTRLANETQQLAKKQSSFAVIGGDHSCAIGTWSGVANALEAKGSIGLIWVDAHLDSHTPQTSESGNIHGMPVACLLGHGASELITILSLHSKLKPENICLIGIRSYEEGEAALINELGVRVFYMDEVKKLGIKKVLEEAFAHVNKNTIGYGISIDLDGLDPGDAPAVGTPAEDGISATEFCAALNACQKKSSSTFLGAEIVEFNPHHDQNKKTQKLIQDLLLAIFN